MIIALFQRAISVCGYSNNEWKLITIVREQWALILRYEYACTETFSEPFNATVSCTANVLAFVSSSELAVEEFVITIGWQAANMADAVIKVYIFSRLNYIDAVSYGSQIH